MRKPFIAGNWKMNKTSDAAADLVRELREQVSGVEKVQIGVCPPFTALQAVKEVVAGSNIDLGAQNMHFEDSGAFTGEISPSMLLNVGCEYVILGHSERREIFGETDAAVNRKAKKAFSAGLKPIICIGETLEEREAEITFDKVKFQAKAALLDLTEDQVAETVLAYEPIWAIGTGRSASPEDAREVIEFIRRIVAEDFGSAAEKMRIQYGGSVKPENIQSLMENEAIDGALVGGASLQADSFAAIVSKTAELY